MASFTRRNSDMSTEESSEEKSSRSEADMRKRRSPCPDLPKEALRRLEDDEDASVRAGVAGGSNAPPEMLSRLAEDEAPEVRKKVAENESAPLPVLERLLVDWEGASRTAARHPKVPEETKDRLVRAGMRDDFSAPFYMNLFWVGYTEHAPEEARPDTETSTPGPDSIRQGWARRGVVTGKDREWLLELGTGGKALVAGHPKTSPNRVEELVEESRRKARWRKGTPHNSDFDNELLKHPEINLIASLQDEEKDVRVAAALNPGASSALLRRLAEDRCDFVREAIALNPSAPPSLLRELYSDWTLWNGHLIARHGNAPRNVLQAALGSQSALTRESAAGNENAPQDLIRLLTRAGSREDLQGLSGLPPGPISEKQRKRLAQLGPYAKALLALHPDTTEVQARELARQIPSLDGTVGPFSPGQLRDVLSRGSG